MYSGVPLVNRAETGKTWVDTPKSRWIHLKVAIQCILFLVGLKVFNLDYLDLFNGKYLVRGYQVYVYGKSFTHILRALSFKQKNREKWGSIAVLNPIEIMAVYLCYCLLHRNAPKNLKLMVVIAFFLGNFN